MSWDFERVHADVIVGCRPLSCFTQLVILSDDDWPREKGTYKAASIRHFNWREALWFCELSDMFFLDANTSAYSQP